MSSPPYLLPAVSPGFPFPLPVPTSIPNTHPLDMRTGPTSQQLSLAGCSLHRKQCFTHGASICQYCCWVRQGDPLTPARSRPTRGTGLEPPPRGKPALGCRYKHKLPFPAVQGYLCYPLALQTACMAVPAPRFSQCPLRLARGRRGCPPLPDRSAPEPNPPPVPQPAPATPVGALPERGRTGDIFRTHSKGLQGSAPPGSAPPSPRSRRPPAGGGRGT